MLLVALPLGAASAVVFSWVLTREWLPREAAAQANQAKAETAAAVEAAGPQETEAALAELDIKTGRRQPRRPTLGTRCVPGSSWWPASVGCSACWWPTALLRLSIAGHVVLSSSVVAIRLPPGGRRMRAPAETRESPRFRVRSLRLPDQHPKYSTRLHCLGSGYDRIRGGGDGSSFVGASAWDPEIGSAPDWEVRLGK